AGPGSAAPKTSVLGGYARSSSSSPGLDLELQLWTSGRDPMLAVHLTRPPASCRGRLELRRSRVGGAEPRQSSLFLRPSTTTTSEVDFDPANAEESRALTAGLRLAEAVARSLHQQNLWPSLPDSLDDKEIVHLLRQGFTTPRGRPSGTCAMGGQADGNSVVDGRLQVHGLQGLRVADASVMPSSVGADPLASVVTIAEVASKLVVEGSTMVQMSQYGMAPVASASSQALH
ncbi:unnamed protein product, partial [Polarella glacialis]